MLFSSFDSSLWQHFASRRLYLFMTDSLFNLLTNMEVFSLPHLRKDSEYLSFLSTADFTFLSLRFATIIC